MKPSSFLLLVFFSILPISAKDSPGLYLRAVLDSEEDGALKMVDEENRTVFVSPTPIITPEDVDSAKIGDSEEVTIHFTFKDSGQVKLGEATRSMIGKKLAIIIDGELISVPVVQSEFSSGTIITGNFTRAWAQSVVDRANASP